MAAADEPKWNVIKKSPFFGEKFLCFEGVGVGGWEETAKLADHEDIFDECLLVSFTDTRGR